MPGDSPALHPSGWFLLSGSGAVFLGAPSMPRALSISIGGPFIALGVTIRAIPFLALPWRRSLIFCIGYGSPRASVSPPCMVTFLLSLRCSVFTFHPCLLIQCFGIFYVPSASLLRNVLCALLPWDLSKVLQYLVTSAFEPLSHASFRALTLKTLFLLALATAKRVGELQALSSLVTFVGADACLSYIPQFVAKSESLTRSIPRSFLVKSLADFAAGLDTDLLLCPVRALRLYLPRARSLSPGRHRLFVSPRRPSRAMSKNAVSFFLREVISAAGAARPHVGSLRAHDVRSVSTSVAFHRNWSVSSVLESATWASSSVFSSFYLRDIQHEFDGLLSLGPFVAAGTRIG